MSECGLWPALLRSARLLVVDLRKGKRAGQFDFTMVSSGIVTALSTNRAASRNTCKIVDLAAFVLAAHSPLVPAIPFLCLEKCPLILSGYWDQLRLYCSVP